MCPVLILRFPMEGITQQNIRLARISQRICHYFIVRRPSLLVRADEVSNRMSGLAVVHMAGRLAIVRHRKPRSSLGAAAFR